MASKFFFKPFVTIPVAPITTGMITHFTFHIRCIPTHKLLYFHFFSASFCVAFMSASITTCYACFLLFLIITFGLFVVTLLLLLLLWPQSVKMNYNITFFSKTLAFSSGVFIDSVCYFHFCVTHPPPPLHIYVDSCSWRGVSEITSVKDTEALISKDLKAFRPVVKRIRTFLNGVDAWDSLCQLTWRWTLQWISSLRDYVKLKA
jgi:hypothetical protein